ncbi:MAG: hypothetical protein ACKVPY_09370 [Paracoccaceae bacterium]
MAGGDPSLSIVVTIVEGGAYVRDFLRAVLAMQDAPPLDVIVPYDDSVADVAAWASEFPSVRFLAIGPIVPEKPVASEGGKHELYDRRRAAGLAEARGDIVAILEDRGQPRADWARTAVRLHQETGRDVIGGAIDPTEPFHALNWAFHVTDFGRYMSPFDSGPRDWVSDVNITYSRKAIEATRHLWQDRYQEPVVNWHLRSLGMDLRLDNRLVVLHRRPPLRLAPLLRERFDWGRLFGAIRVRGVSAGRRAAMILTGPAIPPVLWLRHFRTQSAKGQRRRYLRVLPWVMLLTTVWTAGEVWGYVTKRS